MEGNRPFMSAKEPESCRSFHEPGSGHGITNWARVQRRRPAGHGGFSHPPPLLFKAKLGKDGISSRSPPYTADPTLKPKQNQSRGDGTFSHPLLFLQRHRHLVRMSRNTSAGTVPFHILALFTQEEDDGWEKVPLGTEKTLPER